MTTPPQIGFVFDADPDPALCSHDGGICPKDGLKHRCGLVPHHSGEHCGRFCKCTWKTTPDRARRAIAVIEARKLGKIEGEKCEARAEDLGVRFDKAEAFIVQWLKARGKTSCEEIVDAMVDAGIAPHDTRSFGPTFARLARRGSIIRAGFAMRRKGRGAPGASIWDLPETPKIS